MWKITHLLCSPCNLFQFGCQKCPLEVAYTQKSIFTSHYPRILLHFTILPNLARAGDVLYSIYLFSIELTFAEAGHK